MSELGKIGMVRLVVEWAFGFCNFCQVPIRGPYDNFELNFGFLSKNLYFHMEFVPIICID